MADVTVPSNQTKLQPTKRDRGEGRIFPRKGTPYLWCGYYLRGKEYRESTGEADFAKALKYLRRRMKEVHADQIGAKRFSGPQQDKILVREIIDVLIAEYKRGGKKAIPREVGPQMQSHMNRVLDYFGEMRAMDVHHREVNEFITELKADGKQNATVNRSLQLLGQAYKLACTSDPPLLSRMLRVPKLDESNNIRKGKFSNVEVKIIFACLPVYMAIVARFAYETGARVGEILKLKWSYLTSDAIAVPATDTKSRKPRRIALTPELEEIIALRGAARVPGCELIFHNDGRPIADYRKCWQTVCVINGLGCFYCRDCRDQNGEYTSVLDAKRTCPKCHKRSERPKYIGRLFHDFRRTAAHELWKAGSTAEDCMEVTGHTTTAMFKRYADLFTDEEKQARQLDVQQRRRDWRRSLSDNATVPEEVPTKLQ